MTPTPESAKQSHANGKFGESFISHMIPGFVYEGDNVDGFLDNQLAEIKTCQFRVKHGESTRAGRMFFTKEQHDKLVAQKGSYIMLVQDDLRVVHSKIIMAALLFDVFETEFKTCSWTTIFNKKIKEEVKNGTKKT